MAPAVVARPRCAGCATPVSSLPHPGFRCGACRADPPPWIRAVAGIDYAYPWDRLVTAFKFGQRLDLAQVLLEPLRARLDACPGAMQSGAPSTPACLVPVPLAHERLRSRGYNQAWELARRLAREGGLPACHDALFRVRETGHQLGLDRQARRANLRDAFVVSPQRAARLRGSRVVLVDDVLTTGATARAAAQALLRGGAEEVEVWVIARAA